MNKWKFTSYERDSESGLDYAMFRYEVSRLGRFLTPDPIAGSVSDPQSLNRYAYVVNDPINLVDPLGLVPVCVPFRRISVVPASLIIGDEGQAIGVRLGGLHAETEFFCIGFTRADIQEWIEKLEERLKRLDEKATSTAQCSADLADTLALSRLFGDGATARLFLGNDASALTRLALGSDPSFVASRGTLDPDIGVIARAGALAGSATVGRDPALLLLNINSPTGVQGPISIFGDEFGTRAALSSTRFGKAASFVGRGLLKTVLGAKTVFDLGVFAGATAVCATE